MMGNGGTAWTMCLTCELVPRCTTFSLPCSSSAIHLSLNNSGKSFVFPSAVMLNTTFNSWDTIVLPPTTSLTMASTCLTRHFALLVTLSMNSHPCHSPFETGKLRWATPTLLNSSPSIGLHNKFKPYVTSMLSTLIKWLHLIMSCPWSQTNVAPSSSSMDLVGLERHLFIGLYAIRSEVKDGLLFVSLHLALLLSFCQEDSMFKIPISTLTDTSHCAIQKDSSLTDLLHVMRLIIWDKVSMQHKCGPKAFNCSHQDIQDDDLGKDGVM